MEQSAAHRRPTESADYPNLAWARWPISMQAPSASAVKDRGNAVPLALESLPNGSLARSRAGGRPPAGDARHLAARRVDGLRRGRIRKPRPRPAECRSGRRERRVRLADRTVWLRQEHPAAAHRRSTPAKLGQHSGQREIATAGATVARRAHGLSTAGAVRVANG